ncbi:MAG: hypothetical protein AAFY72_19235, partial [Cyanobacteria bacterium J06649_4]
MTIRESAVISSLYQTCQCLRASVNGLKNLRKINLAIASSLTTVSFVGPGIVPLSNSASAQMPAEMPAVVMPAGDEPVDDEPVSDEFTVPTLEPPSESNAAQQRLRRYLQQLLEESALEEAAQDGSEASPNAVVPFPSLGSA